MKQFFDAVIVVPLEEELEVVLSHFIIVEDVSTDVQIRFSASVPDSDLSVLLVQQNSMGRTENYNAALRSVLDFDVGILICLGIAGGLSSDLNIGDVCATRVGFWTCLITRKLGRIGVPELILLSLFRRSIHRLANSWLRFLSTASIQLLRRPTRSGLPNGRNLAVHRYRGPLSVKRARKKSKGRSFVKEQSSAVRCLAAPSTTKKFVRLIERFSRLKLNQEVFPLPNFTIYRLSPFAEFPITLVPV